MAKVKRSVAPDMFLKVLEKEFKGIDVVKEYQFHDRRRWRFDYAFPGRKVAVEVDGGVWVYGRHNSPTGYINDLDKLNTATSMGWLVLRITPQDRFTGKTLELIKKALGQRGEERDEKG
jgi:very-short-patch-repair endonuclease